MRWSKMVSSLSQSDSPLVTLRALMVFLEDVYQKLQFFPTPSVHAKIN